mgnify:CR=1 FL=1
MTKEEKASWAIQQYHAGAKVQNICDALGITPPTMYRWIRERIEPRNPARWDMDKREAFNRSEAAKEAWRKRRQTPEAREKDAIKRMQGLSLLEILARVRLSLGIDNLGHFLCKQGEDNVKLYLTDQEFKALSKKPVESIQAMSGRINATFRKS